MLSAQHRSSVARSTAAVCCSLTLTAGCSHGPTAVRPEPEGAVRDFSTDSLVIPRPVDPLSELFDPQALEARARRWSVQEERLLPRSLRDMVVDTVAVVHFSGDLSAEKLSDVRKALLKAWEHSAEERAELGPHERDYVENLFHLYQAFPLSPAPFSMWRAPDAEAFLSLHDNPERLEPPIGREYPEWTRALLSLARERVVTWGKLGTPAVQEGHELAGAPRERFSPFFEAIFAREQAPEHVEQRARAVLKDLLEGMRAEATKLREAEGRNLDPTRLFETLHRYLTTQAGVQEGVQPSVVAGLATGYFDCDVYTFVVIELGRQLGLPIDALYVLDPESEHQIGHCLPVAVLRADRGVRYVPFEMREPIHRGPDGSEQRVYENFSQMIERINRLAGEEILGPGAVVCRLTDAAKVELLQPYGQQQPVSIESSQVRGL